MVCSRCGWSVPGEVKEVNLFSWSTEYKAVLCVECIKDDAKSEAASYRRRR